MASRGIEARLSRFRSLDWASWVRQTATMLHSTTTMQPEALRRRGALWDGDKKPQQDDSASLTGGFHFDDGETPGSPVVIGLGPIAAWTRAFRRHPAAYPHTRGAAIISREVRG